jgi:cell wall-associated NlpC family hydrolase
MNKREIINAVINRLLLIPYKWAGDDPIEGFDCSGGIQEILASVGIDPAGDQTADALMKYFSKPDFGEVVSVAKFGDLLFFGASGIATHVAVAVNETILFEFGGGGSKTQSLQDASTQNAFGRFRRINGRKDFLKALRPVEFRNI